MDCLGVPWHPPRPREVFDLVRPGSNSSSPMGWGTVGRPMGEDTFRRIPACNLDGTALENLEKSSPPPALPSPLLPSAFPSVRLLPISPLHPRFIARNRSREKKLNFFRHMGTTRHRPGCWPAQKTVPGADDPGSTEIVPFRTNLIFLEPERKHIDQKAESLSLWDLRRLWDWDWDWLWKQMATAR